MNENIKYALTLKMLREERGWSARELSQLAELAEYTVSRIETGKLNLDFATAVRLTEQLGVSLDRFAITATTLPTALLEKEILLGEGRKQLQQLRKKAKDLRQDTLDNQDESRG